MAWTCKDALPPVRADYGTSGLTTGPHLAEVPDTVLNPFTGRRCRSAMLYAYRWITTATWGCNDFVRDPVAVTMTTAAT